MQRGAQQLTSFDLTIVVISLVIGMGIFRTPTEVAGYAGTPMIFFLAWAAGALISYFGALTFAEIGSRYPATGGFYKIFSYCYSPVFAFMVNWITVISNAASTAAVAIMGSEYLASVLAPESAYLSQFIAFFTVVMLMIINLMGIRVSKSVLNALMILKVLFILLLISCAFLPSQEVALLKEAPTHNSDANSFTAFLLCFVPVFFTYGGYQQTMNFGGDVATPSSTLPRAISRGILLVMLLYLAVNFSYFEVLGMDGMASTKTLASDVIGSVFGPTSSMIVSVILFFAVMTYVNVSIMSNPRVYFAMAEDKVMPAAFLKVNERTNVQTTGVVVFCGMILLTLLFVSSFQKILEYVMFFDSISLIAAAAAIFVLRRRKTGEREPALYRMKGYPLVPILYIAIYGAVNISVLIANPAAFGWGALLFILGFPLFYLIRRMISGRS
ncbi:MAG: APC family permease [Bacteroidota bacterium]|jgi:APA family basic amino acid/polyamine antiporter